MSGISGIIATLFGIFWTIIAASMTWGMGIFGIVFPLFGICFVGIGIMNTIYNFKNATNKNRYSAFDIVDSEEEIDPLNDYFGQQDNSFGDYDLMTPGCGEEMNFCPFCGAQLGVGYEFCPKCGKEIPS